MMWPTGWRFRSHCERYINHNAPVSLQVAERLDKVMSELKVCSTPRLVNLGVQKDPGGGLLLNNCTTDFFVPLLTV